jgi:hypothetical protein
LATRRLEIMKPTSSSFRWPFRLSFLGAPFIFHAARSPVTSPVCKTAQETTTQAEVVFFYTCASVSRKTIHEYGLAYTFSGLKSHPKVSCAKGPTAAYINAYHDVMSLRNLIKRNFNARVDVAAICYCSAAPCECLTFISTTCLRSFARSKLT